LKDVIGRAKGGRNVFLPNVAAQNDSVAYKTCQKLWKMHRHDTFPNVIGQNDTILSTSHENLSIDLDKSRRNVSRLNVTLCNVVVYLINHPKSVIIVGEMFFGQMLLDKMS
jgi:hypothetical protein